MSGTFISIIIDSTNFDTFGKQEKSSYNTHYGTTGYHPLVAYDAVTKLQLFSRLREGSQYTSKGVDNYVRELMTKLEKSLVISSVLFRGDSGFATPAAYEVFEEFDSEYVIRLKKNAVLEKITNKLELERKRKDCTRDHIVYSDDSYQADHHIPVTSLSDAISPETVFRMYEKRGSMENLIKESKYGLNFGKTDSHEFDKNEVRMMITYTLI